MSSFRLALFTGNYNHIRDGVSLTLNRLVEFLEEKGIEVLVFGPTVSEPDLDHNGTLIEVPSIPMPGRPEYRITTGFSKKSKERLESFNPDLVHIATPDPLGLRALHWSKKRGIPVVSSYHTHFPTYLKYYKLSLIEPAIWKILAWFYGQCRQVYVPSPSMAEILKSQGIDCNLKIWARGINMDLFNPERRDQEWRSDFGFDKRDVVVLFVSRLVWEKNLRLFAKVVNKLMGTHKQVKAMVVGDGPARKELQEMMPGAIFTGFLKGEELATAYASSDIFFFPSETETFGNVTLEAMACGLPAVVADATGSKSLVGHAKNGYIIPVERPNQFYKRIEKLAKDDRLREKMSSESIQLSKEYTWDSVNGKLLNHYYEVLEKERS
jgi:glycosyltransferase involved in cell wall biosynthesis